MEILSPTQFLHITQKMKLISFLELFSENLAFSVLKSSMKDFS